MSAIPQQAGVYTITCLPTGTQYVGSTVRSLRRRWEAHRCALRKQRYGTTRMQRAWNKHGEAAFEFKPLLICRPEDALFYEQRAIDVLKPKFNSRPVAATNRGIVWPKSLNKQKSEKLARKHLVRGELLTARALGEKYGLTQKAIEGRFWRGYSGEELVAPRNSHSVRALKNHARGEHAGSSRLTESQVREIRILRLRRLTFQAIAERFKATKSHIKKICDRELWAHVIP